MAIQLGVPLKLLKEFLNRKVSVETSSGDTYRGVLLEAEENMSVALTGVKATFIDGRTAEMSSVYVKGSRIRLISLPDTAKDSLPALTRLPSRGGGRGGFRGGRGGGFRRGGGGGGGGGGKPSYGDRRRY